MRSLYILLVLALFALSPSRGKDNVISTKLHPGTRNKQLNEINQVNFEGNSSFSDETLLQLMGSQPTHRSFPHRVLQSTYREFKKNGSVPKEITNAMNNAIGTMESDITYFSDQTTDADVQSLWHFYNTKGFHFVEIYYTFLPDSVKHRNILTYYINENKRFSLKTIEYEGLESLPVDLEDQIKEFKTYNKGKPYDESSIMVEINQIQNLLLNNGYFYSNFEKPVVTLDTINFNDSVMVSFSTGIRQKIGRITFIDSTKGQAIVVKEMKKRQLEFEEGSWYSRNKVERSKDNLLSLGTFDVVAIDTSTSEGRSDSILNFKVFTQYRKQQEYGAGLFVNQTPIDNYVNLGFELSYFHRNIFGAAQVINPFASFAFKDISRIISGKKLEYEVQAGFKFGQPLLWTIDNSRVGMVSSFLYSQKTLNNYFNIETFSFPFKFNIKFPNVTYFNQASIDFSFDRENPLNFGAAQKMALDSAKTPGDSSRAREMLILYSNLDNYLHKEKGVHILTSNLLGISLTGDSRNHPFSPTRGNYTYLAVDGWNFLFYPDWISGVARFYRFQFAHYEFFPLESNLVLALKGRLGVIKLLEGQYSYVPIDRQFFAGGANSVRGWPSRMLRYSTIHLDSTTSGPTTDFLRNYVGNAGIAEGTIELRYKFKRPRFFSEAVANQIENLGITVFSDFGNAYYWLALTREKQLSIMEYIKHLAASVGFGLRYDTPVGPLRIDIAWPVYDPLSEKKPFSNRVIHFGLGHAF